MRLLRTFALLLLGCPGWTAVLRVTPWPSTIIPYTRIESKEVHVETTRSFDEWFRHVKAENPQSDLEQQLIATVQLEVVGEEEPEASMREIALRAQQESAWAGANLIFLAQRQSGSKGKYTTATFVAYRITYHDHLLEARVLARIDSEPTPAFALVDPQQGDPATRWAAPPTNRAPAALLVFLATLQPGRRVRLQTTDGTSTEGTFLGVDDDHQIWIRPIGVAGLWRERAYTPGHIQVVSLPSTTAETSPVLAMAR